MRGDPRGLPLGARDCKGISHENPFAQAERPRMVLVLTYQAWHNFQYARLLPPLTSTTTPSGATDNGSSADLSSLAQLPICPTFPKLFFNRIHNFLGILPLNIFLKGQTSIFRQALASFPSPSVLFTLPKSAGNAQVLAHGLCFFLH